MSPSKRNVTSSGGEFWYICCIEFSRLLFPITNANVIVVCKQTKLRLFELNEKKNVLVQMKRAHTDETDTALLVAVKFGKWKSWTSMQHHTVFLI